MTKLAAKLGAQKPDPVRPSSWSDYDPHFSRRKAIREPQGAEAAPILNRSNSPYFPKLPSVSRG